MDDNKTAAPAPDAVADTVAILRSRDLELPEFHAMQMRVADLIEQQAREIAKAQERSDSHLAAFQFRIKRAESALAATTAERDHEREIRKHDRVDRERAERDLAEWKKHVFQADQHAADLVTKLSAARAAIAAAAKAMHDECLTYAQYGEQPPQHLLDAVDAARAALGDGNG